MSQVGTATVAPPEDAQAIVSKITAYASAVSAQATQAAAGGADPSSTLAIVESILSSVSSFVSVFFPEAALGGLAATKIIALIQGLVTQVPEAVAAVQSLEAAFANGAPPTADQWAALDAAADVAHANVQAAVTAFLAKQAPLAPAGASPAPAPAVAEQWQ